MRIGRRIYYDLIQGDVLVDTGERLGVIIQRTVEQDISTFKILSERNRDTYNYIELEYGQYAPDFADSNSYRVNPETKKLEFNYPDPNEPEAPPIYQKPLSEQVNANADYLLDVDFRLIMMELGM